MSESRGFPQQWGIGEGRRKLPIRYAVIEEFEVAFPEIADDLLGDQPMEQ